VEWMIFELPDLGVRDSIRIEGPRYLGQPEVIVRPEWAGANRMQISVRDRTGLSSPPASSDPGGFGFHPVVTHPLLVKTTVMQKTSEMILDGARGRLYLLNNDAGKVTVLDANTLSMVRTIALRAPAPDMDLSVSGDSLLVAQPLDSSFAIIDLDQLDQAPGTLDIGTIDGGQRVEPSLLRVAANGRVLFAFFELDRHLWRVGEINLATGAQRVRSDLPDDGVAGHLISRSEDRSYDAVTDAFGTAFAVGGVDRATVSPNGDVVAMRVRLYDGSLAPLRGLRTNLADPPPGTFSPDGMFYYSVHQEFIYRNRVSDGAMMDRFATTVHGRFIRVSPDGTRMVVASGDDQSTNIGVIDLQ
jgi:DNA-binding beta-propeller fold protein YncE